MPCSQPRWWTRRSQRMWPPVRRGGGLSFYVGLDLGQAADFTALAVLEAVSAEEVERELHLRHLERYPLRTPYKAVAEGVAALVEKLRDLLFMRDEPHLLVDNTGVGRAVTDVLRDKGLRFKAITGSQVRIHVTQEVVGDRRTVCSQVASLQLFGEPDGLLQTLHTAQVSGKIREVPYVLERLIVVQADKITPGYQAVVGIFKAVRHSLSQNRSTANATALVSN